MVDRNLAIKVFIRDGWKCKYCGCRDGLHPHHIVFKSQGRKDTLDNLITVCYSCHIKIHDKKLWVNKENGSVVWRVKWIGK